MVIRIPLIAEYLDLWRPLSSFFDYLIQFLFAASCLLVLYVTFRCIPYGKTYTRGSSFFKVELPDRFCMITIHLPVLVVFIYAHVYFPNGDLTSVASLLYIVHYIHRGLIYPWFRRSQSKPWPLETFLYFLVEKFLETTIVGRALIFDSVRHHVALQLFLCVGVIGCAIVAGVHDYKLCGLRKSGDTGYQIPQGLLFKWISGPNYLFELLEWCFFIWFLPINIVLATFAALVLVNISGRAEWNHDAYVKRLFKNKYLDDRCPYIPFVMKSRWLI
jgi:hypothetical protein